MIAQMCISGMSYPQRALLAGFVTDAILHIRYSYLECDIEQIDYWVTRLEARADTLVQLVNMMHIRDWTRSLPTSERDEVIASMHCAFEALITFVEPERSRSFIRANSAVWTEYLGVMTVLRNDSSVTYAAALAQA